MKEIRILDTYLEKPRDVSLSAVSGVATNTFQISFDDRDTLVVFYPPNTFPNLLEADVKEPIYMFGRKAPLIPDQGWDNFVKKIKNLKPPVTLIQETSAHSHIHFGGRLTAAVEAHPISLLNAATALDPGNYSLAHLHRAFTQPIKGPIYGEFIDLILAGKFIDSRNQMKTVPDFEGEALMLCVLLGDRKSAEELIKRRQAILAIDEVNLHEKATDLSATTESGLAMKDLLAVHATEHLPIVDESGNLYIRSIFDGSNESGSRLTIHFALNHFVGSHKNGDWHYRPFVVLAPLTDLIELNGLPSSLRPEDTYFCVSPGEGLKLPESTVLVLPEENYNSLQRQSMRAKVLGYRMSNFTKSDIEAISSEWGQVFWTEYDTRDRPFDVGEPSFLDTEYEHPARFKLLDEFIEANLQIGLGNFGMHYYSPGIDPRKDLWMWFTRGARGNLENIFHHHDDLEKLMRSKSKDFSFERKWVLPYVLSILGKAVDVELGSINKKMIVQNTIESLGFSVNNIEPHYLGYEDWREDLFPDRVKEVLALAAGVGIPSKRHGYTTEKLVEDQIDPGSFGSGLRNNLYLKYTPSEDKDYHYHPSQEDLKARVLKEQQELRESFWVCNPQLRRVTYLMGGYQIADFWDS